MKDAEPPNLQKFKLLSVGLDDGGSSAVLELTEGTASERNKPLTANQKLAKDSYIEAAIKSGIWNDEGIVFAISMRRDTGQGRDNSGTCPDAEAE